MLPGEGSSLGPSFATPLQHTMLERRLGAHRLKFDVLVLQFPERPSPVNIHLPELILSSVERPLRDAPPGRQPKHLITWL